MMPIVIPRSPFVPDGSTATTMRIMSGSSTPVHRALSSIARVHKASGTSSRMIKPRARTAHNGFEKGWSEDLVAGMVQALWLDAVIERGTFLRCTSPVVALNRPRAMSAVWSL